MLSKVHILMIAKKGDVRFLAVRLVDQDTEQLGL